MSDPITRAYIPKHTLKYGCNPHQAPSTIASIKDHAFPFEILNGTPGYINLLDALNSWQLVHEVKQALNIPAAASFKHVSPAGAGIATPLSDIEKEVYDVGDYKLTPQAVAYLRARNADPKCSFGDFAALSDEVDEETALFLKREVSDGIIAPGFTDAALAILKQKKNGAYIILKADVNYVPPAIEYREVYGVVFAQKRNDAAIKVSDFTDKIPTKNKSISEDALRDLVLATIAIKYTQSNSVGYAKNGMMIGVGAGQQSRVDCVKLAASKLEIWYLRQHPKVRGLQFKEDVKRVDKTNARISYIEGGMTPEEQKHFDALFVTPPVPLTAGEKVEWIATLKGVSISSDAFFPFRDNVDQASKRGVAHIAQPAGSVQDAIVVAAADEYGMTISHTPYRLFHH